MKKYSFDETIKRKGTQSVKWDKTDMVFGTADVLPFWVADMDFQSPPEIIKAMSDRLHHGVFGYTAPSVNTNKALSDWLKKRHQWEIESDWIVYSPGIVFAISMAVQAFTNPKDRVLIQTPVYSPFFDIVKLNDRTLVENPLLLNDRRYEMDFSDLEKKLSSGIKLMILCSPHNPVGRVWEKAELAKVADLCEKYNVLLLSDEIHADLIYKPYKHIPTASLNEKALYRTITFAAPSKTFNIPGLQASAAIIFNKELRDLYQKQQQKQGFFTLNTFGIVALEAAYTHGEQWLEELLSYLQENIMTVKSFINTHLPSLKVVHAEGTYLLWIDCRSLNISDSELNRLLIQKGKIAVEPGTKYGEQGSGFIRLNIACPRLQLEEGLIRLKTALSE